MTAQSRTFRVFVSSTFSDLKLERDALQARVFPRLRELCLRHSARFQAIDLRWGVSEQASLDQQTMNICLGEIERCRRTSPRPNFVVLLGDRYGWRPPPPQIPASEFEAILGLVGGGDRSLLEAWYRRDDNAVPAEYLLRPREPGGEFEAYEAWAPIEARLHRILAGAATGMDLDPKQQLTYTASATHQEIAAGALSIDDAPDHVFCFFRHIPEPHSIRDRRAREFFDLDPDGSLDQAARARQGALKAELREHLPQNVFEYTARWTGDGPTTSHIDQLCKDVYESLAGVIREELAQLEVRNPLEAEIEAHRAFGEERCRFFTGRRQALQTIAGYVDAASGGGNAQPLVVWGASGSGKSALMARAVEQTRRAHPEFVVIHRFIGATPDSASLPALLEGLCREITRRFAGVPEMAEYNKLVEPLSPDLLARVRDEDSIPIEYEELAKDFRLRLILATDRKPLVLFLDGLDQLSGAEMDRTLEWLPSRLSLHVRMVISTMPGEIKSTLDTQLEGATMLEVPPLPVDEAKTLLDSWLEQAGRTLKANQRDELMANFADCPQPLFLKLAFEEARRWRSFDGPHSTRLSATIQGLIRDLFARLSSTSSHGPLLVSRALAYIVAGKNGLAEDELLDLLARDVEVYRWFLENLFHTPPDLVEAAVSYLEERPSLLRADLQQQPLTESAVEEWLEEARQDRDSGRLGDLLSTVLQRDGRLRLPVVLWSRLFLDLEPYLTQRAADGTRLLGVFHRQFDEVVTEDYLDRASGTARHRAMANYFGGQSLQGPDRIEQSLNLRQLSELPYQQAHGELWEELWTTLSDAKFLQAKLGAVGMQALLADYDTAYATGYKDRDLSLVRDALELSAHVLIKDETLLWSQLHGRLMTSSLPRIRALLSEGPGKAWLRPLQPALAQVGGALLRTLEGQSGPIQELLKLLISPDGKRALSCSLHERKAENKVWDLEQGDELYALESVVPKYFDKDSKRLIASHRGRLLSLDVESGKTLTTLAQRLKADVVHWATAPNADRALSVSQGNTLRAWDLGTGTDPRVLGMHLDHATLARLKRTPRVTLAGNGRRAVSGLRGENFAVWELDEPEPDVTMEEDHNVTALAVTPDGHRLVSGTFKGKLRVWQVDTGLALQTLEGHRRAIQSVAITPDGKRAVSASADNTLKVWDLDSGQLRATLKGHMGDVHAVVVTPDGARAVSASRDRTVRIWDLESGEALAIMKGHMRLIKALAMIPGRDQALSLSDDGALKVWALDAAQQIDGFDLEGRRTGTALAVTPDGRIIVTGATTRTLEVYDLHTWELLRTLQDHATEVTAVVVMPGGHRLVSCSRDRTIKIWDLDSGEVITTLGQHDGGVLALAITPDGRRVLSGSGDKTIRAWDLQPVTIPRTMGIRGRTEQVQGVVVAPDGRHVVCATVDERLRVWDLETGRLVSTLEGEGTTVDAVVLSSTGAQVVIGRKKGWNTAWDLETGAKLESLGPEPRRATALAVSTGASALVAALPDDTLEAWDLERGELVHHLEGHEGEVRALAFAPDGRTVISGSLDATIRVWDLETGETVAILKGHKRGVLALALSSDGRRLVSSSRDKTLRAWDLQSGVETAKLEAYRGGIGGLAVAPDGKLAFSGSRDTLTVWDLDGGEQVSSFRTGAQITSVAVSLDGKRALVGTRSAALQVWDIEAGRLVRTLGAYGDSTLEISPDGKRLVTNPTDTSVKVWDIDTRALRHTLECYPAKISTFALSPSGDRAVIGMGDGTLRVWDLETGTILHTMQGHRGRVCTVTVLGEGRRAISASVDGEMMLWDLDRGKVLGTLQGHVGSVDRVAVTPDGAYALSGGSDGALRLWDLAAADQVRDGKQHHTGAVKAVHLLGDGKRAVSVSGDGTSLVWDLDSGRNIELADLSQEEVQLVQGAADPLSQITEPKIAKSLRDEQRRTRQFELVIRGTRAYSSANAGTLSIWDLEGGKRLRILAGDDRVSSAILSPGGKNAFTTSDGTLFAWDLEGGNRLDVKQVDADRVYAITATSTGGYHLIGSWESLINVWDLETLTLLRSIKGHLWYPIETVAATPDGRRIVSVSRTDQTPKVWDLQSGQKLLELRGHTRPVRCVAITADGRWAVSGAWDKTLKLWDLETGEPVRSIEAGEAVTALVLSADGDQAIYGTQKGEIARWDLGTSRPSGSFQGHAHAVNTLALTPDGRHMVSSGRDNMLTVWDLESGEKLKTMKTFIEMTSVALTPDGRQAVCGTNGKGLQVWHLQNAEVVLSLGDRMGRLEAVTSDGKHAVTGQPLAVWDLESGVALGRFPDESFVAILEHHDGCRLVTHRGHEALRFRELESGQILRRLESDTQSVVHGAMTPDGRWAVCRSERQSPDTICVWDLETGACSAPFYPDAPMTSVTIAPDGPTVIAGDARGQVHTLRLEGGR